MNEIWNAIKNTNEKLKAELSTERIIDGDYLESLGLNEVKLRGYQFDGVRWLISRYKAGIGCILADEMGLGKTCQTISFLIHVFGTTQTKHRSLVLAPLSVIPNWQNEFSRFAPKLKCLTYVGNQDERSILRRDIRHQTDLNVIITSYEMCLKDEDFLSIQNWNVLVVDEAHRLKNRNSMLHQSLLKYNFGQRLLLTGTPVQNNLNELYALLCFVASKTFKERYADSFVETFKDVCNSSTGQSADLAEILRPFVLRRIKADVLKDLPKKSKLIIYHGLSTLQKKYYKAILNKDIGAFDVFGKPNRTRLTNVLMQLRKCVIHPYLFDGVEPEPFELGEHLIEASGKLTAIDQLLQYLKQTGHKVLLFSQMTRVLDILQDYLGYRGYTYERLDGSVRAEERFLAVKNFNSDTETFAFLLSTRAGGQGLNLTAADTVIFVDSDFNPQNDLQAAARAHRIGQLRNVKVINIVGRSTVEEIILRRAEDKLELTNSVIVPGQSTDQGLLGDEKFKIEDIIKFGLDKLFESDESSLEEIDFAAILGPTVNGEWQGESASKELKGVRLGTNIDDSEDTEEEDDKDDKDDTQKLSGANNMYVFEGTDYSKEPSAADCKIFQQLLDAEKAKLIEMGEEGRSLRKNKPNFTLSEKLFMELPVKERRPRKQLTPEELEQRRVKRAEAAAERAKQEEEMEVRRAQEKKKKREAMWKANGYVSCSIDIPGEEEEEEVEDEEEEVNRSIHYVVGDVTHPVQTGNADAIIIHCVDNSGRWGQGGLFTSIDSRSRQPQQQYTLAGKMKDLSLGDLHIIPIDDIQSRSTGNDFLGLIVAQSRDERNVLSGMKLAALRTAFEKLYHVAKTKKASIHLPRLGYKTPGFNWYGTEHLIQRYMANRSIPTYIYYYPRKQVAKRKNKDDPEEDNEDKIKASKVLCSSKERSSRDDDDKSQMSAAAVDDRLSSIMSGVAVYLCNVSGDVGRQAARYVIAYDGDVHTSLQSDTTHIIIENSNSISENDIQRIEVTCPSASVVHVDWILDSVRQQQKAEEKKYTTEYTKH